MADLIYSARNKGQTYTGVNWTFFKFGPWASEVYERITPALQAIHANQEIFESNYENKEDWTRWELRDDNLFDIKNNELPSSITTRLKQLIHKFNNDTNSLLSFVYKTQPMLSAAPSELLDFSISTDEVSHSKKEPTNLMKAACSTKKMAKFSQEMESLRKIFREQKKNKKPLLNPVPSPRYDEVYENGVEWLDSLSGSPFVEDTIDVEFSKDVWRSTIRRTDDLS
ncbi:hypothetical protein [Legionella septentrionalis]|uniref:Uncharacterized protein n=1 Tax=Legionella septentrionalis TaxID=2498109 RepID=A0A433JGB0_9GAMM|nr:hypothetical protein EKM59_11730 [Legionella septentrionalis]